MQSRKKLRYIFIVYWFLLTYIIACLIWWFIILLNQNKQVANLKIQQLQKNNSIYQEQFDEIKNAEKRKTSQYIGEGSIFLLLIMAGAIFLYRAVRKQLKISQEQQNFMLAITHELKTPIAVAKLNLETLQKRKLDETQQQRLIYNTVQETNRLNSLCNNLLLSTQMEAGRYKITDEEINFSALVYNCLTDFINRFPGKEFINGIEENIFIKGDILLLEMAINNLIDNAIKYTPKDASINLVVMETKSSVILQVKDKGKGIVDAEKNKVFNKYYRIGNTATKASKGTGLGLYLTKKIVENHNADISVSDNAPVGSIFTIHFQVIKK